MTDPEPQHPSPTLSRALAVALCAFFVSLLVTEVLRADVRSFDGFWHLASGRHIVESGGVPRVDPFCTTSEGLDWINLNWLAQVLLYLLYQALGYAGPLALAGALFALALVGNLLETRARQVHPALAVLALGAVFFGVWAAHGIRPRGWSFALLALQSWLLARGGLDTRPSWPRAAALLGVMLLWNNLHGGFVYGYALLGLDAAGSALDHRRRLKSWRCPRSAVLGGVIALGLLGFLLHPHGLEGLVYALTYPRHLGELVITFTPELKPLLFNSTLGRVLEVYLLLGGLGIVLAPRRVRARDALLVVVFLHLALSMRRGVTPLLIVSAPFVAEQWSYILRARLPNLAARAEAALTLTARALPLALAGVALCWALAVAPSRTERTPPGTLASPAIDEATHPVSAADALRAVPGRVFNQFSAGGALAWALYPERRIFIDGRGDLHGRGPAVRDYLRVTHLDPGWQDVLERWQVELVLMRVESRLLAALEARGWRRLHADDAFVVLQRVRERR